MERYKELAKKPYGAKKILVCSRPGVGKTQFAIEYYIDKISAGIQGIFICLEMDILDLMDRIDEAECKKDISLLAGKINNLLINCKDNHIDNIIEYIKDCQKDNKINFMILDYMQLFRSIRPNP